MILKISEDLFSAFRDDYVESADKDVNECNAILWIKNPHFSYDNELSISASGSAPNRVIERALEEALAWVRRQG